MSVARKVKITVFDNDNEVGTVIWEGNSAGVGELVSMVWVPEYGQVFRAGIYGQDMQVYPTVAGGYSPQDGSPYIDGILSTLERMKLRFPWLTYRAEGEIPYPGEPPQGSVR
jgi:hypothetical protein